MEVLLVILIAILGAVIVSVIFNIIGNISDIKAAKKIEPCKRHEWFTVINEKNEDLGLICIVCGQVPRIEHNDDE